ncbi:MAG TPA: inositol monophosphatase family protein, partial [Candidatus Glassbacteria bacterium]|nr:inositol monophosphatase family protein [Candidatus Glassbacteria bacterium]
DREVEELVRGRLAELTPDYWVLGEEQGVPAKVDLEAPYWVVDPVDGTSSFISGLPCWSFSLGLVENDRARFGLVYMPMTGEMYNTDAEGTRVFLNGEPCLAEPPEELDGESVIYVPSDTHRRYEIAFKGKLRSLGSAAYQGIMTSKARTAGVLQGRIYLWDAAAGLALNRAWGIRVGTLRGRPLRPSEWEMNRKYPEPILYAAPSLFDTVAAMITLRKDSRPG